MKQQIIELRQQGKTITEISKALNCSNRTVHYNLNPEKYKATHNANQKRLRAQAKLKNTKVKVKKEKPKEPNKKQAPKKARGNKTDIKELFKSKKDRTFKTIPLELDKLVKVRLDSKTEVYIKASKNNPKGIAALKAKYHIV